MRYKIIKKLVEVVAKSTIYELQVRGLFHSRGLYYKVIITNSQENIDKNRKVRSLDETLREDEQNLKNLP